MTKVLLIETSPKGKDSISRKAGRLILEQLRKKGPIELTERDVASDPLPHLDSETLTAFFTAEPSLTDAQRKTLERSNRLVDELLKADIIIISTPMWNFGIPSALKAWIDHVVRAGKTFTFVNGQPQGLLKGKKVYVVVSSGSVFSSGVFQGYDHAVPYIKSVFEFMGVLDVDVTRVEGTNSPEAAHIAFERAQAKIETI